MRGSHHPLLEFWVHVHITGAELKKPQGAVNPGVQTQVNRKPGGEGEVTRQGSRTGLPGTRQEGRVQSPPPCKRWGMEGAWERVRGDECEER